MRWLYRIVFWGILSLIYSVSLKDGEIIAVAGSLILYYMHRAMMREVLGRKYYFGYAFLFLCLWAAGMVFNLAIAEEGNNVEKFTEDRNLQGLSEFVLCFIIPWLVLVASFQATITKDWFDGFSIKDRFKFQVKRLRYERVKAEMETLKTQLSPHLYKNLLTNIYDLVISQHDGAPDAIVTLKELMEYMLYDTATKEKVELRKEIDFIEKLVEIRKVGLPDKQMISFEKHIEKEAEGKQIIPFALLPFIENVFAHCHFNAPGAFAKIMIRADKSGNLLYLVENSTVQNTSSVNKGGIGIKNLRARLVKYYKNRHQLTLHGKDAVFTSKLEIKLS